MDAPQNNPSVAAHSKPIIATSALTSVSSPLSNAVLLTPQQKIDKLKEKFKMFDKRQSEAAAAVTSASLLSPSSSQSPFIPEPQFFIDTASEIEDNDLPHDLTGNTANDTLLHSHTPSPDLTVLQLTIPSSSLSTATAARKRSSTVLKSVIQRKKSLFTSITSITDIFECLLDHEGVYYGQSVRYEFLLESMKQQLLLQQQNGNINGDSLAQTIKDIDSSLHLKTVSLSNHRKNFESLKASHSAAHDLQICDILLKTCRSRLSKIEHAYDVQSRINIALNADMKHLSESIDKAVQSVDGRIFGDVKRLEQDIQDDEVIKRKWQTDVSFKVLSWILALAGNAVKIVYLAAKYFKGQDKTANPQVILSDTGRRISDVSNMSGRRLSSSVSSMISAKKIGDDSRS